MAVISGTSTASLTGPADRWQKAPTHVAIRNPSTGKTMAVLPTAAGWRLYEDVAVSTTGTILNASQAVRPTVAPLPDGTGFTVVWAALSGTTAWNTYLFSDPDASVATGTFTFATITSHDTCPMTATYSTDGSLWLGRADGAGLVHTARRTSGGTVAGPVQWGTFGASQTGLIVLGQVGALMLGFSSGNDGGGNSSKTIAIGAADIAQANWTSETAAVPALPGGTTSDDHLGMWIDTDGTAYIVSKTTNGAADLLLIYLLRRTPAGVFTRYAIETGPDDDGGTTPGYSRPSVMVAEGEVLVFFGSIYAPNNLNLRRVPVATMVVGAREVAITGPDFSDGGLAPVGTLGAPATYVLANERAADVVHSYAVTIVSTSIPSYQGPIPVTKAYLGTLDATRAYLGSVLVRD